MSQAEITLTIPADSRFIALARLTAAGIAAELDYSSDQTEELSVGANELVAALIEWAEDHDCPALRLSFVASDTGLVLSAEAEGPPSGDDAGGEGDGSHELDGLTGRILAAVVDDYELTGRSGWIRKRRTGA